MSEPSHRELAEQPLVTPEVEEREPPAPRGAWGLCLSGGGYRAMLFHTGALWRLNETGFLGRLDRISSVSGGSIAAGALAAAWRDLTFEPESGVARELEERVVRPIRKLASRTIDRRAVLGGVFGRGSIADKVSGAYRRHLFGERSLQDLPDRPRFIFNATSLQSGALWRFSKPYMGDYRVGRIMNPDLPLSLAVAASSAFPPVLSPLRLDLDPLDFEPDATADLQHPPFNRAVYLSDGGVYDNLGLETVWKRCSSVLVSDAGGRMQAEPEPDTDWAQQSLRILNVIDSQVRSLRKRQVISAFRERARGGCYWGIWTPISAYRLQTALFCPEDKTRELAETPTRLASMSSGLKDRLINWGYASCDAALRAFVDPELPIPEGFPYPIGVG